jgi:hypothetical protein
MELAIKLRQFGIFKKMVNLWGFFLIKKIMKNLLHRLKSYFSQQNSSMEKTH